MFTAVTDHQETHQGQTLKDIVRCFDPECAYTFETPDIAIEWVIEVYGDYITELYEHTEHELSHVSMEETFTRNGWERADAENLWCNSDEKNSTWGIETERLHNGVWRFDVSAVDYTQTGEYAENRGTLQVSLHMRNTSDFETLLGIFDTSENNPCAELFKLATSFDAA